METDFLKNIHELSMEVSDLKHKSDNAMKKYIETRPSSSAESVRRAKKEFKQKIYPPHPILEAHKLQMNTDHNVLEGIRNYKPGVTIFEVKSSSKDAVAQMMKNKRKVHEKYIKNANKEIKSTSEELAEKINENDSGDSDEEIETYQDVVKVTKLSDDVKPPAKKQKKGKYDAQKERDKTEHYISYRAADEDTENALQMDSNNFDHAANAASVEIIADDDRNINKMKSAKKWDRTKKKYVGESNDVKRIRTEEGTLVPASFKSGRYEKWQKSNKIKYRRNDDDDDGGRYSSNLGQKKKRPIYNKDKGNGKKGKNEVKSAEQIFKERRKKEGKLDYMLHRRKENLKKKVGHLKNQGAKSGKGKPNKSKGARRGKR